MSVLAQLKPASPLTALLTKMYGQISSREDANRIYRELRPLLTDLLSQGHTFNSSQVQAIVNILKELPAYGAPRRNFAKLYLKDELSLRKLPADPSHIPKGHWH